MDSTRHQEILDRCWNALPEGCPMRQWDREQFDDVWGHWDPKALAFIDPTCSILQSILLVEIMAEDEDLPDQTIMRGQQQLIVQHYNWMILHWTLDDLRSWNKNVEKCKGKAVDPDIELICYIEVAQRLPLIKGDHEELWGAARQEQIKAQCRVDYPEVFSLRTDEDSWRSIVNKAKKHLGEIPRGKAGRPKN
jgi:hypothetical protein